MSSRKSGSMGPPPIPPFALGLALRKPAVNPYNPIPSIIPDTYTFMKKEDELEPPSGTWTTIDPETCHRSWDTESRRQTSDTSSTRPNSRTSNAVTNPWMQWAVPVQEKFFDVASTVDGVPTTASVKEPGDGEQKIDPEVRRLFVNASKIMLEDSRPNTVFEQRNRKSLAKGSATKIENMIGDSVVSIVRQPIDDRAKYRDHNGNYMDGIDRGKMKERYEDEWRRRLDNRTAQMEHLTKMKQAWEALTPKERARQIERKEANTKWISVLGAGLDSRDGLYEFDEIPEAYRRLSKWTIGGTSTSLSSRSSQESLLVPSGSSSRTLHDKDVKWSQSQRHEQAKTPCFILPRQETTLGKRRPSDRESSEAWSSDSDFGLSIRSDDNCPHGHDRHDSDHSREPPSTRQRQQRVSTDPSTMNAPTCPFRMRIPMAPSAMRLQPQHQHQYNSRPPSGASSSQYLGFPFSSDSTAKVRPAYKNPSIAHSSTSTTVVVSEPIPEMKPVPDIIQFDDLSSSLKYDDAPHDAIKTFDNVKTISNVCGRVVQIVLQDRVQYSACAIVDRIFGGKIQEIQFLPAEHMALVVFVYPSDAASMIRHVRTLREYRVPDKCKPEDLPEEMRDQQAINHEFRRLQINADWYKGSEKRAIYPAQPQIVASVVAEGASRVLYISHVSVENKVQDFAQDMKATFPAKVIVKASLQRPQARYKQKRDGNSGIIEFASIKDAAEIKTRFAEKSIPGYEASEVEWLMDPCEKTKPAVGICGCKGCERRRR